MLPALKLRYSTSFICSDRWLDEPINWLKAQILISLRPTATMTITLHYNATCGDCARKAHHTAKLDWLNRVRISTEASPIGQVARGEIVVVDNGSAKVFTGIYATRAVCMQVPVYFLCGLALYVPPIRWLLGRGKQGCNGDACKI